MVGPPIFDAVPENTGAQRCAVAAYRGLDLMDNELRVPECSWMRQRQNSPRQEPSRCPRHVRSAGKPLVSISVRERG